MQIRGGANALDTSALEATVSNAKPGRGFSTEAPNRRVEDRRSRSLLLRADKLSETQFALYSGAFDEMREKFLCSMQCAMERRSAAQLREALGRQNPLLARYFDTIERRLDVLATLCGTHWQLLSETYRQDVSLSGSGLRFHNYAPLQPGEGVCVKIADPEEAICLLLLGHVVYTQPPEADADPIFCGQVAVRLNKIHVKDHAVLMQLLDT